MANEGQDKKDALPVQPNQFYTPEQVASILSLERGTVYRLLRAGELPGGKMGGVWRTLGADLLDYYEARKARAATRRVSAPEPEQE